MEEGRSGSGREECEKRGIEEWEEGERGRGMEEWGEGGLGEWEEGGRSGERKGSRNGMGRGRRLLRV